MVGDFKAFLQKNNVVALAIGFIMGAAVGKVVTALVNDLIMPLVGMAIPDGDWRKLTVAVGSGKLLIGDLLGTVVDFVIIAFVVFMITRMFMKPEPAPETKTCKSCAETVAKVAIKCKYCGDPV